MTRCTLVAIAAGALILAGCGGAKSGANGQNATSAPAPTSDNAAAPANAAMAPPATNGVASAYTDLNLSQCQTTSEVQEGDSMSWRCPGLGDVPLFVSTGDLRYDIDAGVSNDNFQTLPPFNENPTRIEWRLRDNRPVAIIFRLTLATNEQAEWSTALGVATVGMAGKPGCTIAWVDGNVPDANDVARRIADERAATSRCDGGDPDMIHRNNVPAPRP